MSNKREHPDRLNRWLGAGNRNVSSLSDSSDRGSATSSTSVLRPSPSSMSSSKTNSVAVVTAEESSGDQSRKNGSSETSSDLSGSKRNGDYKDDDSPSPLIHVHKRRKKVHIDSSSSEEKNESVEASSASSDTSEKDDSSSSSSLLYKRGTANSNVKTFVSLRKKQNENNTSSDTSDQDGLPTSLSRAQHHNEELNERDQNDGSSSSSSHDATISKLSSSSYSQSINSSSDTKAEAYASSCSSPPSDTSDQDNARRTKDIADGAVEPYASSKHDSARRDGANRSDKVVRGAMKTFTDSSPSVSASSDTSDPESSGSTSTSSSVKRKKIIVGNAMHAYQTANSSSNMAAFDMCSTSSTSTTSTTKRKKVMIGNALSTYQTSLSSATIKTGEENKAEKESVEVGDANETNVESFLSSSSTSSSTSSSGPADKSTQDEAKTVSTISGDETRTVSTVSGDESKAVSTISGDEAKTVSTASSDQAKTVSTTSSYSNDTAVNNNSALFKTVFPSSIPNGSLNPESLRSKIDSCMYQDYSHITAEVAEASAEWKDIPLSFLTKDPPFPQKLHEMLANQDVQEWIHWLPHGRAWKILNQKKFEEIVLTKYFKKCKLASFMRQVNNWGFKRIPFGPDEKAYYHELFLRGLPHLSVKMHCQPRGKLQERMKSVYAQIQLTPDFYQMSKEHPLPEVLQTSSSNHEGSQLSGRDHSTMNGSSDETRSVSITTNEMAVENEDGIDKDRGTAEDSTSRAAPNN